MTSKREAAAALSPIEDVIADARAGKLFILVDDEDRENEGDLCVIGDWADAAAINFMAKHGRGLICLALTRSRTEALGLTLMERRNESRHQTAFTVSIEAREGVTTESPRLTGRTLSGPRSIRNAPARTSQRQAISSRVWRAMAAPSCGPGIPRRSWISPAPPGRPIRPA